ncbi:phosphatase PAP2 family protein [Pseudobacteriovorax antillogorgiicola]|uniref:PAP2 superfamily protein n=1 Tax=Pseudobacteriovorax antillogorgiicola TaxID=1513793 RepID=A0A1Y6C9V1_9BACT|nr:phosphatase PAP2 family protein [Pseudobacteriovorax antillogorgiicola]TCS48980.1 PAP2 superfamily protein [Pseudobacteriovorax antillogorgiicola]SMF53509.1 PAP2 superfamily protein [Pseudobacteriovorax antillogorgiicola]
MQHQKLALTRLQELVPQAGTIKILVATCFVLAAIGPWDQPLTHWLAEHRVASFAQYWHQSIFEGDPIGASDYPVFLYIIALVVLILILPWKAKHDRLARLWLWSSFILYSGLVTAIGFIHPLKHLWGRARPYLVAKDEAPFSPWYLPGAFDWMSDRFSGSLPSGHTSTFLILITLSYCIYHRFYRQKTRLILVLALLASISLSFAMGVSRSMQMQHWVTDWILSVGGGWALIHYLFYQVWKMDQRLTPTSHGKTPSLSAMTLIAIPILMLGWFLSLRLLWSLLGR